MALTRARARAMARLDPSNWPLQMRIFELEDQLRDAGSAAMPRSHRAIEACAAIAGLIGAWLLASKGDLAAWGWLAFLASNAGWMTFAHLRGYTWLLIMQVGFTGSSVLGIWRWLL